ncbi:unnamed protein product [Rotaria sordida]|uniref:Transmembrane 9 superfamily member n=1 Tax=Rotaria sordida TaxID=392033 RepID=A0A819EST2_9BILA|nr:unnamed protein product [Rotaria sordida]CAF0808062.1 unnamed protein product [Rotaria sordida]CAF3854361.1 unnamed protein product [Rotaria sordida]CAF3893093.1 unnamed protein product [Rotaria sordida]
MVVATLFISFLTTTFFIQPIVPFYIPGVAPLDFRKGENVEVKAVKMTSTKTQLPYDYYDVAAHCKPLNGTIYKSENLGEILRGDRIVNTKFKVGMDTNVQCRTLCKDMYLTLEQSKTLGKRIRNNYYVHLLIDNLPCATKFQNVDTREIFYEHGYRLGIYTKEPEAMYLNNHLIMRLHYHQESEDLYRVVGFEVEPKSIDSARIKVEDDDTCIIQAGQEMQKFNLKGENKVTMTYEVEWASSETRWASRWDTYLAMTDVQIHWFSIINSVIVVFFLAGILSMIIVKTLRRDIARYNQEDTDDVTEETGWKLVHGDVFRPPHRKNVLAALIGSGVQLLLMSFIVIVFAALGMLSPSSRGALITAACFLYVFMGLIAGFYSGRIYKTIKGSNWKQTAGLTATLYPSVVCGVCLILNFFIWGKRSSGAVPFSTMLAILTMWLGISFPLVCLGFYFGYRKHPYDQPVRTNQIPRQVPEQQWFMHPVLSTLIAGVLPFGAMFIELFFIFSAIWENQYYYLFGFLFLVFIIIIISCSQISIVITYFQLCGEDYHWWWRSFVASGGSAFYVFGYSIFYLFSKLDITEFVPLMLYFGYTLLICFTFWILTGTIGFIASYIFVRKIYAAVKID